MLHCKLISVFYSVNWRIKHSLRYTLSTSPDDQGVSLPILCTGIVIWRTPCRTVCRAVGAQHDLCADACVFVCLQVNVVLDDGRSLGLMIRGGAEYALGIYITGVDQGSASESGGLKVLNWGLSWSCCEHTVQGLITASWEAALYLLNMALHALSCV